MLPPFPPTRIDMPTKLEMVLDYHKELLARHERVAKILGYRCDIQRDFDTLLVLCEKATGRPSKLRGLSVFRQLTSEQKVKLCLPKNISPEFALKLQHHYLVNPQQLLYAHADDRLAELINH